MQRLLVGLAVTVLIVAGVGAAIIVLSSRDGGSLDAAPTTQPSPTSACVPDGNVTIVYAEAPDGIRINRLAERLGALNTEAARSAGQAIIVRQNERLGLVVAKTTCGARLELESASDPQLEAFVREHLGSQGAATP